MADGEWAMKVTLDLTKLLEEGRITAVEFDWLRMLGAQDTGSLAFNILIGLGMAAVSAGAVALAPLTAALVGAAGFAFGLVLLFTRSVQWMLAFALALWMINRRSEAPSK